MEPMTMLAIAAVLAGGMQGAGSIMGSSAARDASADELEEKKKQRQAELFSKQRDRQQKSATDFRAGQSDIAKSRAQVLQGMAQNINLGGRNG